LGAYILRRLLLVIPTLLGIMIINFTLTQFVPGGPIEQIIARIEGGGDVFEGIAGRVERDHRRRRGATSATSAPAAFRPSSSRSWSGSSASTSRRWSGS
jgi:ABC-type microcin C transport system permease subunit YejB